MPDQTANRPRPEDFLELVQKGKRGRLKLYIGFAAGVGKTYRMLEEAHALKKRGVDVVVGFVETHGRKETEALIDGSGGHPAPQDRVPRRDHRGDEPQQHPAAQSRAGARRRAGAHERARQPQQEAVPGRHRAAGRGHQRHRRHERATPGEPERRGRARDGRRGPGDRPRQLPQTGGPGRQPGSGRRGPARAAARRQDLRAPKRSPGRWSISSRSRTSPTCASSRCARWPRASSAPARARSSPARSGRPTASRPPARAAA